MTVPMPQRQPPHYSAACKGNCGAPGAACRDKTLAYEGPRLDAVHATRLAALAGGSGSGSGSGSATPPVQWGAVVRAEREADRRRVVPA